MKRNFGIFSAIFFIVSFFASCSSDAFEKRPYYISSLETSGSYATFDFYNNTDKEIESIVFSARIYDSEGESAIFGTNGIKTTFDYSVPARSHESVTLALQEIVGPEYEDSYILDFLYAKEIKYKDGSSWSDPFGYYCF